MQQVAKDFEEKNLQKFDPHSSPPPSWVAILIPLVFIGIGLIDIVLIHEPPLESDSLIDVIVGLSSPFFNPRACRISQINATEVISRGNHGVLC